MRCKEEPSAQRDRNLKEYPAEKFNIKKQTSLQAGKTNTFLKPSFYSSIRRVFLWILKKKNVSASMTVEAAVTVPVFLLTVCTLLSVFDIYRVQALVKSSLHQSALELGMYAYAADVGQDSPIGTRILSSGVCSVYAQGHLPDPGRHASVSVSGFYDENNTILLRARIRYQIPISILPLPPLYFTNESRAEAWVGRNSAQEITDLETAEEMVYVTENGTVYHVSSACTYLDLAIHSGQLADMGKQRNAYGGKYYPCEKCGAASGENGVVFYTEKGNRYHNREDCSGLKRTVRLVKRSEVPGLPPCQRCGGKGSG